MTTIAEKIPDWVVYLLLYLAVIGPLVMPLKIPVPTAKYVKAAYNTIEDLPEGSTVMFGIRMASWNPNLYPGLISISEQVFRGNHKIIYVARSTGALNQFETIVANCPSAKDKVYGEDWIILYPSIKLEDAPNAALGDSILNACPTDFIYNEPITGYPIMEGITDASTIDLLIDEGETDLEATIRQLSTPYSLPTILVTGGVDHIPFTSSKIQAGLIVAAVNAIPQFASYESLVNMPGDALKQTDAFSTTMILGLVLMVIGNISYFLDRRTKEK